MGAADGLKTETADYAKRFGIDDYHNRTKDFFGPSAGGEILRGGTDAALRLGGVLSDVANNALGGSLTKFFDDKQAPAQNPAVPAQPTAAAPGQAAAPAQPKPPLPFSATNADIAAANPNGRVTKTIGANGVPEFSGTNISGQVSYVGADGKPLNTRAGSMNVAPGMDKATINEILSRPVDPLRGLGPAARAKYDQEVAAANGVNAMGRAMSQPGGGGGNGLRGGGGGGGGVDGALAAADALRKQGYVVTHSTLRGLIGNETAQRGQDIGAATTRRGQDLSEAASQRSNTTTLRGQDMDLQGRILPKQMEMEQAARMRGLRADIYKQAGGDPMVAASLAQSYGLDGKEFLEVGEAKSKLSDAGTKAADKRFESMAVTTDKDGRPVVDPAAQAAMRSVRNQVAPGYDNMGPEAQARYDKEIRASQELIQGLNARKDTGWLQMLGVDAPTDALGQLPDLRGGSAPETVGWLDGLMTPNVERGDTRLRDANGREYYVPRKTMNEGTRSLINRLRKE